MKIQNIKFILLAFMLLSMVGVNAQILEKAKSTESEVNNAEEEELEAILQDLESDTAMKEKKKVKKRKGNAIGGLLPGEGFYMKDKRIQRAIINLERRRAMGKITEEKYLDTKAKLEVAKKKMYQDKSRQVPPSHKDRMEQMEKRKQRMEDGKAGDKDMTEEEKAKRQERMERFEKKRAERKEKQSTKDDAGNSEKKAEWVDKRTDWQKEQIKKEAGKGKKKKNKWQEMGSNKGKKGARVDIRESALKERVENGEITQEEYNKRMEQMAMRKEKMMTKEKTRGMSKEMRKQQMKERAQGSKMERGEKELKLAMLKKNLEEKKAAGTITNKRYESAMKQIKRVEKDMDKLKKKEAKAEKM